MQVRRRSGTHVDVVDEVEETALHRNEEEREREVAAMLEQAVVEESGLGALPLCVVRAVSTRSTP